MKTIILSIFTLIFAINLHAQIILNTADLPVAGDVQISVKVDSVQALALLPGSSGPNVLWDFSNLLPCCKDLQNSYDTLTWITPYNTPYSLSFPNSNLAYKENCSKIHSHVTHKDEEFCNYIYCIKNNDGILLNGFYKNDVKIYDKMRFLFPLMQYGDTLQQDARLIYYTSVDTIKVKYFQNISIADGWGTIITPLNTTDALRVYTTEIIYDSMYVNNIGSIQSTSDSNFYYHWFTKNLGFPVLQIVKGSLHQENIYYQDVSYSAIKLNLLSTPEFNQNKPIQVLNVYGSRAIAFIFPEDISTQKYILELFDVTGRKINPSLSIFGNKIIALLDNYPGGIYLYKIENFSQTLKTGKLSLQ